MKTKVEKLRLKKEDNNILSEFAFSILYNILISFKWIDFINKNKKNICTKSKIENKLAVGIKANIQDKYI